MTKRRLLLVVVAAALAGAALAVGAPWLERPSGPARTVAMSMSGYAFNGKNPTLTFRPGERVRFVVTNDEPTRILHNFRVVGMNVECGPPLLPGERREVEVTMPHS